jgi:hypothetical protein
VKLEDDQTAAFTPFTPFIAQGHYLTPVIYVLRQSTGNCILLADLHVWSLLSLRLVMVGRARPKVQSNEATKLKIAGHPINAGNKRWEFIGDHSCESALCA